MLVVRERVKAKVKTRARVRLRTQLYLHVHDHDSPTAYLMTTKPRTSPTLCPVALKSSSLFQVGKQQVERGMLAAADARNFSQV